MVKQQYHRETLINTKLRIIKLLTDKGALTPSEMLQHIQITQPALSFQLRIH